MKTRALLCAALLVAASGCAATTGPPTRSAAQLQDLGQRCLAAGQTADALKYLTEAEQKNPNDASLEYALALAYDQRELQDKALSHLQKALKIKPDYPEALNALGVIYTKQGKTELARGAFQKALDDPFYRTPQLAAFNLGMLYEKNGDLQRALSFYQQAVKFKSDYAMAYFRTGQILEQMHRDDEARHAYGKAVNGSPELAEALLRFGILSHQSGDLAAAIHSLSRVEKIAPNSDLADEARKCLEKINPVAQPGPKSRARSHVAGGAVEVIPSEDLQQTREESPPGKEVTPPARVQPESSPGHEGAVGSPEPQPYRYIVQLGSFPDMEKANEIKSQLQAKGYDAVVKTVKDRALGHVFVIQLQPVNSLSKANTLMVQLGGEIGGEAKIIKVRAQ
jgi:Flp pilus assembly protein TadD